MFESATVKLTLWYLLIIMVISFLFSGLVYQSATSELDARIQQFGQRLPKDLPFISTGMTQLRDNQIEEAKHNILFNLIYINILILASGGVASLFMARRTLRPLEEAHAAESRFVSDASHELRTPLAAMKAELEVALMSSDLSNKETNELLASNLEEVEKLTNLSQTLLSLSRLDYDSLKHKRESFDDILDSVLKLYANRGRKIEVARNSKPIYVNVHRPSLEELLTILIDNALKYSPHDSNIDVSLRRKNGRAVFRITNQGSGIDKEKLPHIFERFYRADSSRTSGAKRGFGLGLSIAKTIVEIHRGELLVSSAPNEATTFTLSLPLDMKNLAKTTLRRN